MAVRANCARAQFTMVKSMFSSILSLLCSVHHAWCWLGQLVSHVLSPFLIGIKFGMQKVGKKENLQDGKHDKKLDKDDFPQGTSDGHLSEAVYIKEHNTPKKTRPVSRQLCHVTLH
jgi:hypothetical protein